VPVPDYDEYFQRLAGCDGSLLREIQVALPIETARGCWWGERRRCAFCGMTRGVARFRSRPPELVRSDIAALTRRHGVLRLAMVDNILAPTYRDSVLSELANSGEDYTIY